MWWLMKLFPYPTPRPLELWSPPLEDSGTKERRGPWTVKSWSGARVVWEGLGAGVGLGLGGCRGEGQAVDGRSRLGKERWWFRV